MLSLKRPEELAQRQTPLQAEQLPEGRALEQLKAKDYAAKYRGQGKPIHVIGVEFSRERREVVADTPLAGRF